jgi:hypothetical protein
MKNPKKQRPAGVRRSAADAVRQARPPAVRARPAAADAVRQVRQSSNRPAVDAVRQGVGSRQNRPAAARPKRPAGVRQSASPAAAAPTKAPAAVSYGWPDQAWFDSAVESFSKNGRCPVCGQKLK